MTVSCFHIGQPLWIEKRVFYFYCQVIFSVLKWLLCFFWGVRIQVQQVDLVPLRDICLVNFREGFVLRYTKGLMGKTAEPLVRIWAAHHKLLKSSFAHLPFSRWGNERRSQEVHSQTQSYTAAKWWDWACCRAEFSCRNNPLPSLKARLLSYFVTPEISPFVFSPTFFFYHIFLCYLKIILSAIPTKFIFFEEWLQKNKQTCRSLNKI